MTEGHVWRPRVPVRKEAMLTSRTWEPEAQQEPIHWVRTHPPRGGPVMAISLGKRRRPGRPKDLSKPRIWHVGPEPSFPKESWLGNYLWTKSGGWIRLVGPTPQAMMSNQKRRLQPAPFFIKQKCLLNLLNILAPALLNSFSFCGLKIFLASHRVQWEQRGWKIPPSSSHADVLVFGKEVPSGLCSLGTPRWGYQWRVPFPGLWPPRAQRRSPGPSLHLVLF